jgi:hypothetical protein
MSHDTNLCPLDAFSGPYRKGWRAVMWSLWDWLRGPNP